MDGFDNNFAGMEYGFARLERPSTGSWMTYRTRSSHGAAPPST